MWRTANVGKLYRYGHQLIHISSHSLHLRSPCNSAEVCINPEDAVTVSLKHTHTYLTNCMVWHLRRQQISHSAPLKTSTHLHDIKCLQWCCWRFTLLGYDGMSVGKQSTAFQRITTPLSSHSSIQRVKIKTAWYSNTSQTTCPMA